MILPPILWDHTADSYFLQAQALSRFLRILNTKEFFRTTLDKCLDIEGNEVNSQFFAIIFELVSITYIVAGIFMIVENTNPINFGLDSGDRTFLQSYYFVIVTLFTVGYGDISPKTPLGMVLMIVFCLVYIGYRLTT